MAEKSLGRMKSDPSSISAIDMADFHLERLNDENAVRWEHFNNTSADGSLFHSLRWKELVDKCCATKEQYTLLYKGEDVVGLFPFIEDSFHFFRGFSHAGDPQRLHAILKDYNDPFAMQYVVRQLQNSRQNGKKISFIRYSTLHEESLDAISSYPLYSLNEVGDMVLDLSETPPEKIWNSFSAKKGQRKFIRRFDEDGFTVTEADSEDELHLFYRHYEDNINFIGGTVQPYSRFSELRNSMSDDIRITLLTKGSVLAGGMLMLSDKPRRTIYAAYLSLNRNLPNTYHPTYYLFCEGVNWAWENHYEKFSFGAQHFDENSPRYRMKKDFGARFNPLYSRIIPLTKLFTMGVKWEQWRSSHQSPASPPKADISDRHGITASQKVE